MRGSAAAAAVAALGGSPFGSRAYALDAPLAVANRRVGYGSDAASQLRLAAQLSRNPKGTMVFLDHGPTPELGATIEAEIRNLVTQIPDADGGVLAAEQFYAHAPLDGLPGRTAHFYRWRTADGVSSDVRSAATAMPSTRGTVGGFRFTMMGDQGPDETPLLPPGLARGAYDSNYYKPDNDPTVAHADNVLNQIIASRPDFHVLAGDIAYEDPSGLGKPAAIVDKIVTGRVEKLVKTKLLLDQPYIRDPSITVKDLISQYITKMGENIRVSRFVRFNVGEGQTKSEEEE
jgi:hypothetical protein